MTFPLRDAEAFKDDPAWRRHIRHYLFHRQDLPTTCPPERPRRTIRRLCTFYSEWTARMT